MKYQRYPVYKDSGLAQLGKVPVDWSIFPIKYAASFNDDVLAENTPDEYEIEYVEISGVNDVQGIEATEVYQFKDAPSRARRRVKDGDVIVSTVRTYLKAIASIKDPPENLVVSTGFAVIRPREMISPNFTGYLFRANYLVDEIIARSTGVSYPAINASELVKINIAIPPLSDQEIITIFLDRETAKIDTLIAKQERLIALLQEKRQALISHVVTKGLNPDVPMKDSGVEWVGEIPKHWGMERNKWIFQQVDDRSVSGDEELLSVSHITGVTPRSEKTVNMFMAETLEGYKRCQPGDLVINTMWAYMGALGATRISGVVSPSYNVYRPRDAEIINPQYIDHLYRTPRHVTEIGRNSRGVWESRLRLYPKEFLDMQTPLPPRAEQDLIVDHIHRKVGQYALAEKRCLDCIDLLQERRSALISAAVTGKIDVRNLVN